MISDKSNPARSVDVTEQEETLDLLLVDPPYKGLKGVGPDCGYTLGIAYLAAYIREAGMKTAILTGDLATGAPQSSFVNFNVKSYANGQKLYEAAVGGSHPVWDKMAETIRRRRPLAVGISYLSPTKAVVDKIAALVKGVCPGIKVIVGGHHATFCPEEILGNTNIDFVIRGEGEKPLLRLMEELKKAAPDLESVPGLNYRAEDGRIASTPDAELISDLDSLPFPARDLVLDSDYSRLQTHIVATARGCPYMCAFCSDRRLWNGKVRRRSVGNVMEELKMLNRDYPLKTLQIVDGTFTYDRQYVLDLCAAIVSAGLKLRWRCTARYDNIDAEMLDAMKEAGCEALYFGIESGSARMLDAVKKRITVAEIKEKSALVRRAGLISMGSVLLGLPGETRRDIEETLRLMRNVQMDLFDVNCYVPLPGTPLFDKLSDDERGRIDWRRIAYKALDGHFTKEVPAHEMETLTASAHRIALRSRNMFLARMLFRRAKEKVSSFLNREYDAAVHTATART